MDFSMEMSSQFATFCSQFDARKNQAKKQLQNGHSIDLVLEGLYFKVTSDLCNTMMSSVVTTFDGFDSRTGLIQAYQLEWQSPSKKTLNHELTSSFDLTSNSSSNYESCISGQRQEEFNPPDLSMPSSGTVRSSQDPRTITEELVGSNSQHSQQTQSNAQPSLLTSSFSSKSFRTKMQQLKLKLNSNYICPAPNCGQLFSNKAKLGKHALSLHPDGPKPFQCTSPGCSFGTFSPGSIHNHLQKHSSTRKFKSNCKSQ